jgi:hypothetical protein
VESIRHAQQATGIGAHAHDHESALRRAHAMHVHRNEDGSVMDEASAALVASLHAAQERKDVQVALEMHAREEARENARLARVNVHSSPMPPPRGAALFCAFSTTHTQGGMAAWVGLGRTISGGRICVSSSDGP